MSADVRTDHVELYARGDDVEIVAVDEGGEPVGVMTMRGDRVGDAASLLEGVALRGVDPVRDGWGMETDPQRVADRCAGLGGYPALVATRCADVEGEDPSDTYGYDVDGDGVPCDTGDTQGDTRGTHNDKVKK